MDKICNTNIKKKVEKYCNKSFYKFVFANLERFQRWIFLLSENEYFLLSKNKVGKNKKEKKERKKKRKRKEKYLTMEISKSYVVKVKD